MTDWASFLTQTQIAEHVLDEVRDDAKTPIPDNLIAALRIQVSDAKTLKQLRAAVKEVKPFLSSEMRRVLQDELRDIADDVAYLKTDRGKTQLVLNRWLQPWYKEAIRSNPLFDDVLIGGHAEKPFTVFLTGEVESKEVEDQLLELVTKAKPPFPVENGLTLKT